MIAEVFLYATARTSPPLRRLGLVGDAVALWSRAGRRRRAWAPHEARCHEAVRRAMAGLPRRDTAVVLGSGLLRDVPFDAMTAEFRRVILVDAVHLAPSRLKARGRAEMQVVDLTGAAGWIRGERESRAAPLAALAADPLVDLVVSANVLSQLPWAIGRQVERSPGRVPASCPENLPAAIVAGHLSDLAAFRARTCLLTDTAYRTVGRDGSVEESVDLLRGVAVPPADETWDWEVAPRGEIDRHLRYIHRVGAWRDIGPALRAAGRDGAMR